MVDGGLRSASAAAVEATTLLTLNRTALLESLTDSPELVDRLLRSLGSTVRRLTDQAADLVFLDLHGRVAKLLLGLAEERGASESGGGCSTCISPRRSRQHGGRLAPKR